MAHKGAYPTTGGWIKPIAPDSDRLPSPERYPSKTRGTPTRTTEKPEKK